MSVAYRKQNQEHPMATIYVGPAGESADRIRAQVALGDMGEPGPIFAEAGQHGYPDSFDNVTALCRYVIQEGGRVVITTLHGAYAHTW